MSLRIGIDIGGTKTLVVVTEGSKILANRKIPHDGRTTPHEIVTDAKSAIVEMLSLLGRSLSEVVNIGAGVPGSVDGGMVLCAPNLGWENIPLGEELQSALGSPVTLLQDTRAAAAGEYLLGAGRGAKLLVCVTLGTGVGCGITIGGKILDGALGCAGELGHFPAGDEGRQCACGRRDCMELYSSGNGITERAREIDPTIESCRDVFVRACHGDVAMNALIEDAAHRLGTALVSVCNLLSPDVLLFSGGLSREREYVQMVADHIRSHCYKLTAERIRIAVAELGELAPAAGCAMCDLLTK